MTSNQIDLETAQEWATNWRKEQPDTVKGYLIPQEDIITLYKQITTGGGQDVRGYLGIRNDGEYKLMFVPVDSKGNDLIDLGIYDMTKPCPDCCDVNSPLYNLQK